MRSERFLVPGSCDRLRGEARVPVLLINRPAEGENASTGFGAGWDLITPAGWGESVPGSVIIFS